MKKPLTPSRKPRPGSLLRIGSLLGLFLLSAQPPLTAEEAFTNPIAEDADPWVVQHGGEYLWCQSEGNSGISLWISNRLTSLGNRHVIWRSPDHGPYSREICPPEIHFLDHRWHVYLAASDGRNENHLTYVLRSDTADPLSSYTVHGPMATGAGADGRSPNIWAIDMTVLEHQGKRYAIWSGWDAPGTDRQFLYIAPMKSPVETDRDHTLTIAASGTEITVLLDSKSVLRASDATYSRGSVGLRVVNTHARFSDFTVRKR